MGQGKETGENFKIKYRQRCGRRELRIGPEKTKMQGETRRDEWRETDWENGEADPKGMERGMNGAREIKPTGFSSPTTGACEERDI